VRATFTPNPIINAKSLTDLVTHIQKSDAKLYNALAKGWINIDRAYGLIKSHEDRLILLEKTKKACSIYNDANIATVTAVTKTLTFNSEDYDNDDMHDAVNTSRITIKTPGYYDCGMNVTFASNATGFREARITVVFIGGGTLDIAAMRVPAVSGFTTLLNISRSWRLDQGDYLEFKVQQNSTVGLDVVATARVGISAWAVMDERRWNPEDLPNRYEE
jgi:hypothetical protein